VLPEKFIERIKNQNYIDSESLIRALNEPSPVSIRINPLKWHRKPLNSGQVPWCRNGFYLATRPSFTLDPLFHAGCYYPQEASSMFLEQIFRSGLISTDKIRILDLCAAPGGKATHISYLAGTESLVVANDAIGSRARLLADNVTKWGMSNSIVTWNDPSAFGRLEGFFDVILADVPCSGEGMFRESSVVSEWSEENAFHCSLRQKRILMDVWPALKENGILIYCTCTFNPAENEENINWLVAKLNAEIIHPDNSAFDGISCIGGNNPVGYGFYPGKITGEGLYISVIRKKERTNHLSVKNRNGITVKPTKEDIKTAETWTNFRQDKIMRSGNDLFHFPGSRDDYSLLSGFLRIIKPGTKICTLKNRDYLPSYELALSSGIKNDAFPSVEFEFDQAISFLKKEEIKNVKASQGWFIPVYNSVNLGFVNNIGHRFNNYFPVDWRIRMSVTGDARSKILSWEDLPQI
jgi:16S rRNA C967 or C1407 C5-methylase (RsmB/RsmF family)/NOL1/NOP2/fmu family ribosome biogenesis protein